MKDKIVPVTIASLVVLAGIGLLLVNVFGIQMSFDKIWPAIPIVIGLLFVVKVNTDYGVVFPATILIGTGLIFFIHNLEWFGVGVGFGQLWPLFPIVVGLAFVALYAFKPHDWGVLIPASACLITGVVFLSLQNLRSFMIFVIAPIVILVGVLMIVSAFKKPGSPCCSEKREDNEKAV